MRGKASTVQFGKDFSDEAQSWRRIISGRAILAIPIKRVPYPQCGFLNEKKQDSKSPSGRVGYRLSPFPSRFPRSSTSMSTVFQNGTR